MSNDIDKEVRFNSDELKNEPQEIDIEKKSPSKEQYFESDAGDGTKSTDQHLHGLKLVTTLFSCLCCLFLTALDQTIVTTILETVGNKFHNFEQIGWLSSGFLLTTCVFASVWGNLSIIFGRKNVFLFAVLIFEIGSLICALANSMGMLIGGRVIAGVGGGGIQVLNSIIITEVVKISKRSLATSLIGVVYGISSILGPLLGGAFTSKVSWRWCFYINLPVGGFAAGCIFVFFNPPRIKVPIREKLKNIDYVGIATIAIGLTLILLGLSFGGVQYPWKSAAVICCFVIGGVFLILFIIWNFRFSKNPIVPMEVIVVPQIVAAAICIAFSFFFYMGIILYLSVYFQVVQGADAWMSGVSLLPLILTNVIASIGIGYLLKLTRYIKPYSLVAAVLGPLGCGILALLKVHSPSSQKIGLLIPVGISMGFQFQTRIFEAQLKAPKSPGGLIMTMCFMNFIRTLGGTLGAEVCQTVFNTSFKSLVNSLINKGSLKNVTISEATQFISFPSTIKNLPQDEQELIYEAVMQSLKNVFYACTISAGICLIFSFFTTNNRLPKDEIVATNKKNENDETIESKDTNETANDTSNTSTELRDVDNGHINDNKVHTE